MTIVVLLSFAVFGCQASAPGEPQNVVLSLYEQSSSVYVNISFSEDPSVLGSTLSYQVNGLTYEGSCSQPSAGSGLPGGFGTTWRSVLVDVGCKYEFSVTASNSTINARSTSKYIFAVPRPTAPQFFYVSAFFQQQVDVSWEVPANMLEYADNPNLQLSYVVQLATSSSFTQASMVKSNTTISTSATFANLTADVALYIRVYAVNQLGAGPSTSVLSAIPRAQTAPPQAPQCCGLSEPPLPEDYVPGPLQQACPGPLDAFGAVCALPGEVRIDTSMSESAKLSDGVVTVYALRVNGFSGEASFRYGAVGISAVPNVHFIPRNGTVFWKDQQGQPQPISFTLIDTKTYTPGGYKLKIRLELFGQIGISLGGNTSAMISVVNNNAKVGTVSMSNTEVQTWEGVGTLYINATRMNGTDCNAVISWRIRPDPAFDQGHYRSGTQTGTFEWADGEGGVKQFGVKIIDNSLTEPLPGEYFFVEIFNNGLGCAPVTPGYTETRVLIIDNDAVGKIVLYTPQIEVLSTANFVYVTVGRIGGSAQPISLDYYTEATGTARMNLDFEPRAGTLIWEHGDIRNQTVAIKVLRNGTRGQELYRTLTLKLAYIVGTTVLDDLNTAMISIVDVDALPGAIGFAPSYPCRGYTPAAVLGGNCFFAREGETFILLPVNRTGGSLGEISVSYHTEEVTALAGVVFKPASGVLTWASRDTSVQYIRIEVYANASNVQATVEYLRVILQDVSPTLRTVDPTYGTAFVGIIEEDGSGSVSISFIGQYVLESDRVARFALHRLGNNAVGSISAVWETMDGTVVAGEGYEYNTSSVTW